MLLVLSDKGKGMQSSSEQPLVGEEHCVTTQITAAKETNIYHHLLFILGILEVVHVSLLCSCTGVVLTCLEDYY